MCEGNRDQYDEFLMHFNQVRRPLFAYIFAILPNRADAEDVFQRTSLVLWKKFSVYDRLLPFLPWACSVAHHEVQSFVRTNQRGRLHFDTELIGELAELRVQDLASVDRRVEMLRHCLQKLKRAEREFIERVYQSDFSAKDVGEALGLSPQTVYNRLSILRRKLGECIQRSLTAGSQP